MQKCSLIRKNRKRGPDVWLLRWSDKSVSGNRIYRKRAIGTIEEYPDSESARRAVASLITRINAANPRIGLCSTTLSQLSNPGFDVYRLRKIVAPRFGVSCPFCSTTPADMNCSTAIRFIWFVRARSARKRLASSLQRRSGPWRMVLRIENVPWCCSPHRPACVKANYLVWNGAISILRKER